MSRKIDCLIIGHNEMSFEEYEKSVRKMGVRSGAYRDLELNFVFRQNKSAHAASMFNDVIGADAGVRNRLRLGESFSGAIAYLGTYLHRRGLTFDFVNAFQDEKDLLIEKLQNNEVLTVAITTTLYVAVFPIIEIVQLVRKYCPSVRVIVGGPFIATQARVNDAATLEYLFQYLGADFYVNSSQGEAALVKLIQAIKNNSPLESLANVYYKKNNRFMAGPVIKEDNPLEENMVDWGLFSSRVGEYVLGRTSISCPFSCSFCGFPEHAGKYRTAAADDIEQELNRLAQLPDIKSVFFIDDTFNVPMDRFKEIMRMMIKNRYPFHWHANFRCQFTDREMVELMKESGCQGVFLGIESGNDQILKNMNKVASVDKYRSGIALLKEMGILTYGSFIVGFPGETLDTAKDTVAFIKESGLDFYRAQLWYCEPITPIYRQKDQYEIRGSHFEWSHRTMNSKTAADLVEEMFMTIGHPIWVPQYGFDFDSLFHLLHRGYSLDQVKGFIRAFNQAVRRKVEFSRQHEGQIREISDQEVEGLRDALQASTTMTAGRVDKLADGQKAHQSPDLFKETSDDHEDIEIEFNL